MLCLNGVQAEGVSRKCSHGFQFGQIADAWMNRADVIVGVIIERSELSEIPNVWRHARELVAIECSASHHPKEKK